MIKTLKLSIIVITWNRLDFTKKCLEAIFKTTKKLKDKEIIVVDNGSTDGTIDYLCELEKREKINLAFFSENEGCGKATNAGMAKAQGEFIVEIDNDIEMQEGWWEEGFRLMEATEKIGQIGFLEASLPMKLELFGIDVAPPNVAGAWIMRRKFYDMGLRWPEESWKEVPWQAILFSAWIKSRRYLVGNLMKPLARDLAKGNHYQYLDYYKKTFGERGIIPHLDILLEKESKIIKPN